MNWKKAVFENFKLYAVTDIQTSDTDILQKIDAAYRGGADIVQLRAKHMSDRALMDLGKGIRKIADRERKLFFVNDRIDIALAVSADGIHLGQNDFPIEEVRRLCRQAGVVMWIGKSTHSLEQALAAEKEGADYIGVGPIFETPTKPQANPVGPELVRQVSEKIGIPFVAIGGINQNNVGQVLDAGAARIAVVRAVFSDPDPTEAARRLVRQIDRYQRKDFVTS